MASLSPGTLQQLVLPTGAGEVITDTSSHDGRWNYMHVIEDAVLSALSSNLTNGSGLLTKTLTAGQIVGPFDFTSVTLTSGTVIMMNRP